ncbi:MAG: ABC transporter permease [Gammaproteobacteria bacterium]|nr:ABC transporter permease [Gammaproteobacteria bacterium]
MFKRFKALLYTRNREFLRDRSAFGWNILMPVLIIAGFAVAFTGDIGEQFKVGVINQDAATVQSQQFLDYNYIDFYSVESEESALEQAVDKVRHHQVDLLLDAEKQTYWVNTESPNGYLVEKILLGSERSSETGGSELSLALEPSSLYKRQTVTGRQVRYIDWVLPGVLSMNMMFSALFGVGFVIVRYRKNGMLRRLKATPITPFEYLSAQVVSRMILIMCITAVVFYGTHIFVDFVMNGSHVLLFLVFALGTLSMISLSLIIAARVTSEETAGGLLNLFSWPMMFLSGVWFSLEGAAPVMLTIAEFLPLTHVTAAARAVMIDGAGLVDIGYHLLVMAVQSVIFLFIGSWFFKWE